MTVKKFLTNLTKSEEKRLIKLTKEKEDIMLLVCDGTGSLVSGGSFNVKPPIALVSSITFDQKICIGSLNNKPVKIGDQLSDDDFVRLIIDSRDHDSISYFLHHKGKTNRYDSDSISSNDLLIAYVETDKFAQLSLFDGQLSHKISDIFVANALLKQQIRVIAFSIFKRLFPELDLQSLDNKSPEDEQ